MSDILKELFNFIGIYVIGRYMLAPRIARWLERNYARLYGMWLHFYSGHQTDTITECDRTDCTKLFAQV